MGWNGRIQCSIAAAAVMAAGGVALADGDPSPILTVRVYNYAGVPEDWMRSARLNVMKIFAAASVAIIWTDPLSDREAASEGPLSSRSGMFTVHVLLRSKRNWGQPSKTHSVMGDALPADACAGSVSLFYEQLLHVTNLYRQPVADVLALALAHELGHVLLPPPGHSPIGIMEPTWDGDGIRHAVLGQLRFTAAQSTTIRGRVASCSNR